MPEARIQSVNQYLSTIIEQQTPCWELFSSGSSNHLYRAIWGERELVLRLNAPAEVAFGVDRSREAALLAQLAGMPWLPSVVRNDYADGWLLMHWHGDTAPLPLNTGHKSALMAAVAQWQQIELPDERLLVDYSALFRAFEPQFDGLPMERPLLTLVEGALKALGQLPAVPVTITHHDLHPGNFCFQTGQLVVLDWEYGGLGSPWFDAAAMHLHCGIEAEQIAMLPAFAPLDQPTLERGLKTACWLLETLETLWYWARGLDGSVLTMKQLMQQTVRLLKA